MLVAFIILAIIVAIAIVIFAVKAANINNAIEDIYAKQALLHEKYCNHEDRIDGNYKSIAELNRRQDEWVQQHADSDAAIRKELESVKGYVEWLENVPVSIKVAMANAKRTHFAELRKTTSGSEAAKEIGVSQTTAKRYEKWRKENDGK